MPDSDLALFERLRSDYIQVKSKYENISQNVSNLTEVTSDLWVNQARTQKLQEEAGELKRAREECEEIQGKADSIPIPNVKKFSDIVDQMIYDFKELRRIDIFIQKLAPGNYLFGTKKIYAKVVNGVLLVRVGGGFMDIDNFYSNYGEQEYYKWKRQQDEKNKVQTAADQTPSSKKAETFKMQKKGTQRMDSNSPAYSKSSGQKKSDDKAKKQAYDSNTNADSSTRYGEYEISLVENDDSPRELTFSEQSRIVV